MILPFYTCQNHRKILRQTILQFCLDQEEALSQAKTLLSSKCPGQHPNCQTALSTNHPITVTGCQNRILVNYLFHYCHVMFDASLLRSSIYRSPNLSRPWQWRWSWSAYLQLMGEMYSIPWTSCQTLRGLTETHRTNNHTVTQRQFKVAKQNNISDLQTRIPRPS